MYVPGYFYFVESTLSDSFAENKIAYTFSLLCIVW